MKKFRWQISAVLATVTLVTVVLEQAFIAFLFERRPEFFVTSLTAGLPVALLGLVVLLVLLGRLVIGPGSAPGATNGAAVLDRWSRLPMFLFLGNLALFTVVTVADLAPLVLSGHAVGTLDLSLIFALHLSFGFMATLQEVSWIEDLSQPVRRSLGVNAVPAGRRDMSLRQRLFLVNLGSVVLAGLLAGMAALGFYREVVAYYSTLDPDVVAAASTVSAEALTDNELKVVVQLGLLFLAVLGWAVLLTTTALTSVMHQLRDLESRVAEMASGDADLGRRAEVLFFDEVGSLTGRINALMARMQGVVGAILSTADRVLESTGRVRDTSQKSEERLAQVDEARVSAFQALGGQGEALRVTMEVAQKLEASSGEVKAAADDQHEAVTRGAAAMEQMATSVSEVSALTARADSLAVSLRTTSEQGGRSVEAVRQAMGAIQAAAQAVSGTVGTIKKTASQTNLLAMNAAIEAAHAGAAGLGFAVVAAEVRTLAETSSQGAKTINDLMRDMDAKIAEGDRLAHGAGEAFSRIYTLIVETSEVMGTVARAMEEQRAGTETILETTRTLREASTHIGTITEKQVTFSEDINKSVMVLLEAGAVLVMAQDVQTRAMTDLTALVVAVAEEADENLAIANDLGQTVAGFRVH